MKNILEIAFLLWVTLVSSEGLLLGKVNSISVDLGKALQLAVSDLASIFCFPLRHLLLPNMFMETFGPCQQGLDIWSVQNYLAWTKYIHGCFKQDQNVKDTFGVDQMHYGSNILWTLNRIKCLLTLSFFRVSTSYVYAVSEVCKQIFTFLQF